MNTAAGANNIDLLRGSQSAYIADSPLILSDIYEPYNNIVIWRREITDSLRKTIHNSFENYQDIRVVAEVTPNNVNKFLNKELKYLNDAKALIDDITELVDMFSLLLGSEKIGMRLVTLRKAMCPRFHVDRVTCRLVTTYCGEATQWLSNHKVNRSKLCMAANSQSDSETGIYQKQTDIQQLQTGDVALLKGESWPDNENHGIVHRSPEPLPGEHRLMLTLDML